MAKPSVFGNTVWVVFLEEYPWRQGWHRILKYNYELHMQILFILQSLEFISLMSRGFSQYAAAAYALPWIIFQTNQSYERWPSAALRVLTNFGNP
jgi:hypothetical protein